MELKERTVRLYDLYNDQDGTISEIESLDFDDAASAAILAPAEVL